MTNKYQNKYRISSIRLQNWDYSWDAGYFVTICAKHMKHYFGRITKGKMHLSEVGILADVFWHEIKHHAPHVILDAFVVMPNHVHGIIYLNGNNGDDGNTGSGGFDEIGGNNGSGGNDGNGRNDGNLIQTRHALSLRASPTNTSNPKSSIGKNRFQNQGKNTLSSIMGSYKSAVTKHAHRLGFEMQWQERFYEHIIRHKADYHRIANYIKNNPAKWQDDKFHK